MAEQRLNTRIISKHITLDQANTGTWKPYEGEIVLARVDTQKPDGHGGVINVPTYLMKVGAKGDDGNLIAIKDLQWAHAPASDVYAWAKQERLGIVDTEDGNVITSIEATTAGITIHRAKVALSTSFDELSGAVEALETALGEEVTNRTDGDTALDNKITAINQNLDGTTAGGVGARLTAVEGVASGAATKAGTLESEFNTYKTTTVPALLADKVDSDTYDAKMAALDAEDADIRSDFAAADTAVKTELIGATGSTIDSDTIAGAKLYAADVAASEAAAAKSSAEGTAASALASAKSELEGKITEANNAIEALNTANTSAHSTFTNDINDLKAKVANVSNVMDFVGAGATLPAAESSNKGDVFVINEGDNAGKEYVFDGTTWVEFGFATANENAISQLQEDIEKLGKDVEDTYATKAALEAEASARGQAITDVTTAFGNADTALKTELTTAIGTAKQGAYDDAVAEAARLDGVQTTEITNAYTALVNNTKTAIETTQSAVDAAQDQKITALEDEVNGKGDVKGLRTLITEEAARADGAEKANAAAIKAISDDYLKAADKTELSEATAAVAKDLADLTDAVEANKADVDANFVKVSGTNLTVNGSVIIFDCGGAEAE